MLIFSKYEGAGNDFIVVDAMERPELLELCKKMAPRMCDRHFGIGGDGILVVTKSLENSGHCDVDCAMHVVNCDGSVARMCGNGIRCVAAFLRREHPELSGRVLKIDTLGGLQSVECLGGDCYELKIAKAVVESKCSMVHNHRQWCGIQVDVGNPHAVFEVQESPSEALQEAGAFLSHHKSFPDGCNIEFIRALGPESLEIAIYERGVGPTLACGTGCIAAAAAWASEHQIDSATIELHAPGGLLSVRLDGEDTYLRGPACFVFSGAWPLSICS